MGIWPFVWTMGSPAGERTKHAGSQRLANENSGTGIPTHGSAPWLWSGGEWVVWALYFASVSTVHPYKAGPDLPELGLGGFFLPSLVMLSPELQS